MRSVGGAIKWGVGVLALACALGAAAEEPALPVIENAGYAYCVNEANDAVAVGRLAMVFKRSQMQVETDPSLPPRVRRLAPDFFRAQAEGRAPSYVHFGLHRFRDCLAEQKVRLEVDDYRLFACLARMDLPVFFQVFKNAGETLEAATPKVQAALAGWQYPEGFLALLAPSAWALRQEREVRDMQTFLFSSCLLPPGQVNHYYHIVMPPDAKAAAGAPPGAGKAPARATPGKGAATAAPGGQP